MPTVTTLLRLADDTTTPITITRAEGECDWTVVPQGYSGPRCSVCDTPLYCKGLCDRHYRESIAKEKNDIRA